MKKKIKTIGYVAFGFLALNVLAWLVSVLTKSLAVKDFTQELGIWGPIFLTLGVAFGGIFVPMTSLPFLLAGLALYGFWTTFVIYYLGNTIIAPLVDFWIARNYGRPVVVKLAGKKAIKKVDKITEVMGIKALVILRVFGGILFDSISYATGLTNIDFKIYYLLTAILPIPGMLITVYLVNKGLTISPLYFIPIVIFGYGAGALTGYLIFKEGKKNQ